jgi:hypothetical protein
MLIQINLIQLPNIVKLSKTRFSCSNKTATEASNIRRDVHLNCRVPLASIIKECSTTVHWLNYVNNIRNTNEN